MLHIILLLTINVNWYLNVLSCFNHGCCMINTTSFLFSRSTPFVVTDITINLSSICKLKRLKLKVNSALVQYNCMITFIKLCFLFWLVVCIVKGCVYYSLESSKCVPLLPQFILIFYKVNQVLKMESQKIILMLTSFFTILRSRSLNSFSVTM